MPFDAATPVEPIPMPPREPGAVRAIVLYDPINPTDRTIADLEWHQDKTLAEYLDGLPESTGWIVSAAGRLVEREEWEEVTLLETDTIIVAVRPEKGAGQILALVAMIALAVAAPYIAGPAMLALEGAYYTAFVAGFMGIGGMLVSSLLMQPPKPPDRSIQDSSSSPSYGLDGPKPTATQDTPVPVVYGEFRTGGNRVNYYSENSADGLTQTLYMQHVVSEGPIEQIADIEINGQPIANFTDVEVMTSLGGPDQVPCPWFQDAVTPYFIGSTITTSPTFYDTIDQVDRVRFDVTFPAGLYTLDRGSGNRSPRVVNFTVAAQPLNASGVPTGTAFPIGGGDTWGLFTLGATGGAVTSGTKRLRLTVKAVGAAGSSPTTPYAVTTNITARPGFFQITLLNDTKSGVVANNYLADGSWSAGEQLFTYELDIPEDETATVTVTGGTVVSAERMFTATRIRRSERNAIRATIDSGALPARGRYRLSISRTNAESTSDYESDKCVLTAVNEVTADQVALKRSAWYALKIRLTDQLSNEPSTTALVRGRKVWRYDANGSQVAKEWSANPADVALDILLSEDWQRPLPLSRIDFPVYDRWRSTAAGAGLGFNASFDYRTSVWDALATVMRVGRAAPVVSGTRWSLVMEAPDEPVMMFGDHNILKGSFENSWLGREGRSNHIEVQYYDAEAEFKRRSVYAIDEQALGRGEPIRQATINLVGVTNKAQAQAEADLQLRMNMAISQSCRFTAGIDAIGCTVGDVVLVQHNLPKWGWADRVKAVSWPTIHLNRAIDPSGSPDTTALTAADSTGATIPMPAGDWRLLVLKPTALMGTALVNAVSGSRITLAAAISYPVHRVVIAGKDYEVTNKVQVASETVLTLDRAPGSVTTLTASLWQTDVMIEAPIDLPYFYDRKITVSAGGWTSSLAIEPGDHIMFGRVGKFKKPFRVTRITRNTDHDRKVELVEYNPWVYNPHTPLSETSYAEIPAAPLHVLDLSLEQTSENVQGGGLRYIVSCGWSRPLNDQRGHAGSRVYVSINDGDFRLHETIEDGRETSQVEAAAGDLVRFKVVAFDRGGRLAPFVTAPIAAITVSTRLRQPPAPIGLAATGGQGLISVTWNYPTDPDVKTVEVYESATSNFASALLIDSGLKRFFVRSGLGPVETRYFWIRHMSFAGQFSPLAGPVSATTTLLGAADIQDGILNTAKFAAGITPVEIVNALPATSNFEGRMVFLTTDDKLYRWTGASWTSAVPAVDITGQLTAGQIAANAITSDKIEANAIIAGKIATGAISSSQIAAGQIKAVNLASETLITQAAQLGTATVTTLKIGNEAVTLFAANVRNDYYSGNGANQTITSFTFISPEARDGIIMAQMDYGYPGAGRNWVSSLKLNGATVRMQTMGGGIVTPFVETLASGSVVAGSNTLEIIWNAEAGIEVSTRVVLVLMRAR